MKELNIGGIIVLDNVSGETEQIVEPMVVSKVTSRYIVMIDFIYDYFVVVYFCIQNYSIIHVFMYSLWYSFMHWAIYLRFIHTFFYQSIYLFFTLYIYYLFISLSLICLFFLGYVLVHSFINLLIQGGEKDEDEGTEPEPPQPFQWTED